MGVMASGGSGREISTFEAEERSLNWLRAFTKYSVRLRLCFSTAHSTQISGRTFWLSRYGPAQGPEGYDCMLSASCSLWSRTSRSSALPSLN